MASAAVMVLQVVIVIVAVGTPVKTTLLAAVEETVVVKLKPIVTVAAPFPQIKLLDVDDMEAVLAVITFVPVSGPTMDTPKPADVSVEEMTLSAVPDAAPT